MIKVRQLAHVCIFAHDLEATRAFYRDVLGLDTQFNFLRDGKVFGFYLNCGGRSHVEVFQNNGTAYSEQNQINHFCLEVEKHRRCDYPHQVERRRRYGQKTRLRRHVSGLDPRPQRREDRAVRIHRKKRTVHRWRPHSRLVML